MLAPNWRSILDDRERLLAYDLREDGVSIPEAKTIAQVVFDLMRAVAIVQEDNGG